MLFFRMARLGIGSKKLKMNEESLARDDTVLGPRYWVGLAAGSGGCGDYAGRSPETEPLDPPGPSDQPIQWLVLFQATWHNEEPENRLSRDALSCLEMHKHGIVHNI